jgi:hypothetical protein
MCERWPENGAARRVVFPRIVVEVGSGDTVLRLMACAV